MMYSSSNQMALSRIDKSSSLVAAEGEAQGRLKSFVWFVVKKKTNCPTVLPWRGRRRLSYGFTALLKHLRYRLRRFDGKAGDQSFR